MTRGIEIAVIFSNVMNHIWGDDNPPHDFMVKAIADKVRGLARCNAENALDVLERAFGEWFDIVNIRASDDDERVAIFTVKFNDGSSVMIEAPNGIGSSVEVLSRPPLDVPEPGRIHTFELGDRE